MNPASESGSAPKTFMGFCSPFPSVETIKNLCLQVLDTAHNMKNQLVQQFVPWLFDLVSVWALAVFFSPVCVF